MSCQVDDQWEKLTVKVISWVKLQEVVIPVVKVFLLMETVEYDHMISFLVNGKFELIYVLGHVKLMVLKSWEDI